MARLIDADYLRNKLIPNCPIEEGGIPLGDFNAHQEILKLYPTVIRCKNCQSHEPCEVRNRVWCSKMGRYMKEDGFCSEGANEDG